MKARGLKPYEAHVSGAGGGAPSAEGVGPEGSLDMGDSGGNREMIHGESSLQGAEGAVDSCNPCAMGSLSDLMGLPTGEK